MRLCKEPIFSAGCCGVAGDCGRSDIVISCRAGSLQDLGILWSGDSREISFLFQRVSVLVQRFNSVLLRESFAAGSRPDDDL